MIRTNMAGLNPMPMKLMTMARADPKGANRGIMIPNRAMDGVVMKMLAVLLTLLARLLFQVMAMPIGTPTTIAREHKKNRHNISRTRCRTPAATAQVTAGIDMEGECKHVRLPPGDQVLPAAESHQM